MYYKNQELNIKITATSSEGSGIGHHDGMVVFVVGALEGDEVVCHLIKITKNYLVAKIKEFIKKSPYRIDSDCPVSVSCGGCTFRELDYQKELEIKNKNVYETIKRIGGCDLLPEPILSGKRKSYRNKAAYPVRNDFIVGFYANKSHRIIPSISCAVTPKIFEYALKIIINWGKKYNISAYNEENNQGILRHVVFRFAEITEQLMITLVINSDDLPHKNELIKQFNLELKESIKSINLNINKNKTNVIFGKEIKNIYGEKNIEDILCGLRFKISPLSFYQVNREMAEKLYYKAIEYAEPDNKIIFDLYCGNGTIGLSMANKAKKIIGIEIEPSAIENAKINAKINNINNAEFICGDALNSSYKISEKPDIIILDPPRKGVDNKLLVRIMEYYKPEKIIYISCNPSTIARDIKILSTNYKLEKYTPVDLFPGTKHIEVCSCLTKIKE